MSTRALRNPARRSRGFSLIELLLAVFILGLGVISISALFPAGIAQQRKSVDDVLGPIVANNALAILRQRIRPEDFAVDLFFGPIKQEGDFPWSRPAFFRLDANITSNTGVGVSVPAGSISIFDGSFADTTDTEVPYNTQLYGAPPTVILTQGERAYPMYAEDVAAGDPPAPQYFWECMFRRFQGRVQVAIFVYRVTNPPGDRRRYAVAPDPGNASLPPLPIAVTLDSSDPGYDGAITSFVSEGAWDADGDPVIDGTQGGTPYNPDDARQAWQEPGQWILDQNNNIYRVLGRSRLSSTDPVKVELVRPVPATSSAIASQYFPPAAADTNGDGLFDQNVAGWLWYLPVADGAGRTIAPVFLLVEEL